MQRVARGIGVHTSYVPAHCIFGAYRTECAAQHTLQRSNEYCFSIVRSLNMTFSVCSRRWPRNQRKSCDFFFLISFHLDLVCFYLPFIVQFAVNIRCECKFIHNTNQRKKRKQYCKQNLYNSHCPFAHLLLCSYLVHGLNQHIPSDA